MTLPKDVQEAMASAHGMCARNSDDWVELDDHYWQTIHAHLLSQDAEIARLQEEIDRRFGIAAEMIAARRERDALQSRLAAADALLRECVHFIDYGGAADDELAEKIDAHLRPSDSATQEGEG